MAFRIPQLIVCAMLVVFLAVLFAAPGADAAGPAAKTVAPPPFITHEFGVILFSTGENESRPTCALQSPEFIFKPVETAAEWGGAIADARHRIGVEEFQNIAFTDGFAPEKPVLERPGEPELIQPDKPGLERPDEPKLDSPEIPELKAPSAPDLENGRIRNVKTRRKIENDSNHLVDTAVSRAESWNRSDETWQGEESISESEQTERESFVDSVRAVVNDENIETGAKAEVVDELFLEEGLRRGVVTQDEYDELKDLSPQERRQIVDDAEVNAEKGSVERDRTHHSRWAVGLYDPFLAFYPANPSDWPAEGTVVDVDIAFNNGKPFYWYPYAEVGDSLNWQGLRLTTKPRGVNARTKLRQAKDIVLGGEHTEHWYETARGGGSLYLSAGKTYDKFLFYGGVTTAKPALSIERVDGRFYLSNLAGRVINDIVLISKNRSEIYYSRIASISPGVTDLPVKAVKLELSAKDFADEEASRWGLALRKAGLFKHEVDAAVNMMRKDLFESDGTRAIYLTTGAWAEESRQLTIFPAPIKHVNVMVCAVLAD